MKHVKIYPYNQHSESVAEIKAGLGIKAILREGSRYVPKRGDTIINWGCGALPAGFDKCSIINKPAMVAVASHKLKTFETLKGQVNIPDYTTDRETARNWTEEGIRVVGRCTLTGSSGAGIELFGSTAAFDAFKKHDAVKLYVKYIPKVREYRVHVLNDKVIDIQRKIRNPNLPDDQINWQIRSHLLGHIFVRGGLEQIDQAELDAVKAQALASVKAIGLDFAGVDVIWNDKRAKAFVLELNTAPGLAGQTVTAYCDEFKDMVAR